MSFKAGDRVIYLGGSEISTIDAGLTGTVRAVDGDFCDVRFGSLGQWLEPGTLVAAPDASAADRAPGPFESVTLARSERDYVEANARDFGTLLCSVSQRIPAGRYASLFKTSLEEAAMWADKAISHTILTEKEK